MPNIRKTDVHRFKRYLRALIKEAVRNQCDGVTSDEVSSFIQNRLKTDVKNRVNALLAIGSELGLVNKKDEGRYVVKKGAGDLDKALDKCYRPKKVSPPPMPSTKDPGSSEDEEELPRRQRKDPPQARNCIRKKRRKQPEERKKGKRERSCLSFSSSLESRIKGPCSKLGSPENCVPPKCCKRIKRYVHRKQRKLPGYKEEVSEKYYSGPEA